MGKGRDNLNSWLSEQLRTIKNLCDTAQLLIDEDKPQLLPTILELLQVEIQQVVEENCVKRDA